MSRGRAEFHGERIVEMHMQRLGGKEQLLAQVYSAIATRRDDTVELALRAYGALESRGCIAQQCALITICTPKRVLRPAAVVAGNVQVLYRCAS